MIHDMKTHFIVLLALMFVAACANSGYDLNAGKEARRAGDMETARYHLEPLAEFGIDEAKYELAVLILRDKKSSTKDYRMARTLLTEVEGRRKPNATYELGRIQYKGLGVKKNVTKAKNLYQNAGDMGYPRAYYDLAKILKRGKNYTEAYAYCEKAFYDDYTRAAMCLGEMHEKAQGTKRDFQKALAWYMIAERDDVKNASKKVKELTSRLDSSSVSAAKKMSVRLEK